MKKLLVMLTALAIVAPAMAAPVSFTENWDSYYTSPEYGTPVGRPGSPWVSDPHMTEGGDLWIVTTITPRSDGYSLLVNNTGWNGKDYGIQAPLVSVGLAVEATDLNPLDVSYWAKANTNKNSDWYFELSLGDVHAPEYGSAPMEEPIPVIAYCKPYTNSKAAAYFDGKQWLDAGAAGYFDTNSTYEEFTMSIDSNSVIVDTSIVDEPQDIARAYLGAFDRVSINTRNFTLTTWTVIDDIAITGGNIIPEPATMILLGLGAAWLRRRVPS